MDQPVKKKQKQGTDGKEGGETSVAIPRESLLEACTRGASEQEVRSILEAGVRADIDQADGQGRTALMWACYHRHQLGVVRALITARPAAVNHANNNGATPLYFACHRGHLEVVRYLVAQAHADVNQAMNIGTTPLFFAADRGFFGIVRYLASARARLTQLDSNVWQNEQVLRALGQGCQDRLRPLLSPRLEDALVLPPGQGGLEPVLLPLVLEYALPVTWEDVQEQLS